MVVYLFRVYEMLMVFIYHNVKLTYPSLALDIEGL